MYGKDVKDLEWDSYMEVNATYFEFNPDHIFKVRFLFQSYIAFELFSVDNNYFYSA